ncbi:MAG: 30S ribosomal protein S2 [Armatimonadetes bacterium]|nr:30S ribosomal protein S2 [Anaerolineae bacterium]
MPSSVTMKQLLEMGVHFGHRTQKWNPKMAPYIFTQRNGIHILDLQQTIKNLNTYYDQVREMARGGGTLLFVGTKRQAQETIAEEANRCGMPYINTRWLGGTLTNWRTIRSRLDMMKKLEQRREKGEFELLTKREALMLNREIDKLELRLGGIRNMKREPEMLFIVDTKREYTAVKEANTLNIPILALVDSNSDPDKIDYILPGNDDAMRSIKLMVGALADAVIEGKQMRGKDDDSSQDDTMSDIDLSKYAEDDGDNERLLGKHTLAKLRDISFEDDDK